MCVCIFPVSFCNPYRPAFVYVSVCCTDTFFLCRRVYLTIQLVHSFAGDGFKSIPQILYVYPKYMQRMKWIMTKLSPVLVVFVSFSLSTLCFIAQAVLLSDSTSVSLPVCVCAFFVYLPFFLFVGMNGPDCTELPEKKNGKREFSECRKVKKKKKKNGEKHLTCTQRINNRAEATTLKTFKSAKRILFPIWEERERVRAPIKDSDESNRMNQAKKKRYTHIQQKYLMHTHYSTAIEQKKKYKIKQVNRLLPKVDCLCVMLLSI